MKRSSLLFTSGALFVVAVVGCQAIAGIQTRTTDPLLTGCNLPGVAPAGGVAAIASTGNGKIRLVNLGTGTATGNADFCVRVSGTSSWGRPVFRDGGNDSLCSVGLKYQQSTVPFSVPAGKIDVRAIPAGKTCDSGKTSEIDGVTIGDTTKLMSAGGYPYPPVTILRYGNATNEQLSALPEEPAPKTQNNSTFRLVNALATAQPINVGLAADSFVPTTVTVAYPAPIAPGKVETGGETPVGLIDAEGYLSTTPGPLKFGASLVSDTANDALVVFDTPLVGVDNATLYVAGDPADNAHTVQGLYCEDAVSLEAAIETGSVDAGTGGYTSQDTALLALCTPTQPPLISVDTINAGLYGANAPYPDTRETFVYGAIAARRADVMCVVEMDKATERQALAAQIGANQAGSWFQYTYNPTTDISTQPTLPSDAHSPPTVAPCDPSIVPASTIQGIFNCVNSNCSSNLNDSTFSGYLETTGCLFSSCAEPFLPIYNKPGTPLGACFDCLGLDLSSQLPLNQCQTACTTDTRQPFAFLGQTPEMILSHHPLSNQQVYVLPSTGFRRAVLGATVTLENNQQFDFFCTQLISPLIGASLPYDGYYGPTYEAEQTQEVNEAIAWIQQQVAKDKLPAILTGDFHATNGTADGGAGVLGSQSPEVIDALEAQSTGFQLAVPSAYTQLCDYCPSTSPPAGSPANPYNTGGTVPLQFLWTFLIGFSGGSTQTNTLWGTDNNVTVTVQTTPTVVTMQGPISEFYPRNVTVLRPPAK